MTMPESSMLVLRTLSKKVRVATEDQLMSMGVGLSATQLRRLVRLQLLSERRLAIGTPTCNDAPLASWTVGARSPDFGRVAWQGRCRMRNLPSRSARLFWATPRAAQLVGGCGSRLKQPWQVQHDLGVTAVYLRSPGRIARVGRPLGERRPLSPSIPSAARSEDRGWFHLDAGRSRAARH